MVEQAHLGLTPAASRFPFAARLSLDAALNDGWLRANTLELYALRSHAAVTGTAVRWSDVLTGRTGRLLGELTAGRTVLQRLREHRAQLQALGFQAASQALAACRGRNFVLPDDVKVLVVLVLFHRIILKTEARLKGRTEESLLREVLDTVPVPAE